MKRIITLTLSLLLFAAWGFSQKPKPKSVPAKTKSAPPRNYVQLEMEVKLEDGSTVSEALKAGDKLVYRVNAGGSEYDFIVTLNRANPKDGFDFNYEMTNAAKTKGRVKFSFQTKWETRKYVNFFKGGDLNLKDAITVWLSGLNFSEMPDKKTEITLDNNPPEMFYRPENDEYAPVIKIKGREMTIDGFRINNAEDGNGKKTIYIQNRSSNSLILKMDLGWTIELKEIR